MATPPLDLPQPDSRLSSPHLSSFDATHIYASSPHVIRPLPANNVFTNHASNIPLDNPRHPYSMFVPLHPLARTTSPLRYNHEGFREESLSLINSTFSGANTPSPVLLAKDDAAPEYVQENATDSQPRGAISPALNFIHSFFQIRPTPLPASPAIPQLRSVGTTPRARRYRASALPIPTFELAPCVELPSSDSEGDTILRLLEEGSFMLASEEGELLEGALQPTRANRSFLSPELSFELSPGRVCFEPFPAQTEATETDEASHSTFEFGHDSLQFLEPVHVQPFSFCQPCPSAPTPLPRVQAENSWSTCSYGDTSRFFSVGQNQHGTQPLLDSPSTGDHELTTALYSSVLGRTEEFEDQRALSPGLFSNFFVPTRARREESPFGPVINGDDNTASETEGQKSPVETRQLVTNCPYARTEFLPPSPEKFLSGLRRPYFRSSMDSIPNNDLYGYRSESPTPPSLYRGRRNGGQAALTSFQAINHLPSNPAESDASHQFGDLGYPVEADDRLSSSQAEEPTHIHPFLAGLPTPPNETPRTSWSQATSIDPSTYTSSASLDALIAEAEKRWQNTLAPFIFPPQDTKTTLPPIHNITVQLNSSNPQSTAMDILKTCSYNSTELCEELRKHIITAPWLPGLKTKTCTDWIWTDELISIQDPDRSLEGYEGDDERHYDEANESEVESHWDDDEVV